MSTTTGTSTTLPPVNPVATAPPDNTNCLDKCSLNIGSCLFGIAVKIHYTFFILWILEVVIAQLRYNFLSYTVLLLMLYGPILFFTILIHEFGHCLMNRFFGGHVDHILIWPLGGFAIIGPTSGNVMQDFWVALAGPLTHLPQITFWILIYAIFSKFDFSGLDLTSTLPRSPGIRLFMAHLAAQAVGLNILLFIFNLFVPAYPLDGGRCLAAMLVQCGTDVTRAATITAVTAIVIAVAMIAYAIYNIGIQGQGPGLFLILIAVFIIISSSKLYSLAKADKAREHPLFNRPCYLQQTTNATRMSGGGGGGARASTTTTATSEGNVELGNPPREVKPWYDEEG